MIYRLLLSIFLFRAGRSVAMGAQPAQTYSVGSDDSWNWNYPEEGGGSAYLGITSTTSPRNALRN